MRIVYEIPKNAFILLHDSVYTSLHVYMDDGRYLNSYLSVQSFQNYIKLNKKLAKYNLFYRYYSKYFNFWGSTIIETAHFIIEILFMVL